MLVRSVWSVLFFAMPLLAFGQVPNSVYGHVQDSSGEPLPGVEVILQKSNMQFSRSLRTGKDGVYHFDCLEKGVYTLNFKLTGFITERLENFTYSPPSSLRLDRELQLDLSTADVFIFPADSPDKALVVIVRDSHSNYLENVRVTIYDGDLRKESSNTNSCGNATIFLAPGKRYSVRISKDGFEQQSINIDMPSEPKHLDIYLHSNQ
jgi:hypothetical protein